MLLANRVKCNVKHSNGGSVQMLLCLPVMESFSSVAVVKYDDVEIFLLPLRILTVATHSFFVLIAITVSALTAISHRFMSRIESSGRPYPCVLL